MTGIFFYSILIFILLSIFVPSIYNYAYSCFIGRIVLVLLIVYFSKHNILLGLVFVAIIIVTSMPLYEGFSSNGFFPKNFLAKNLLVTSNTSIKDTTNNAEVFNYFTNYYCAKGVDGRMGNGGSSVSSNYLGVSNGITDNNNQNNDDTTYLKDIPTTNGNPISNKMYDSLSSNYANQYYNQFVSAANKGYGSGLGSDNTYDSSSMSMPKNELIEKLNYVIDLLEEQQDYKTNSILEDLILYAFLGIFIIFIVDSFSKSNKYVR